MQTDRTIGAGTSLRPDVARPVRTTWLSYGKQSISKEDIQAVVDVLSSDFLTQGPAVTEFEKAVAKVCGAKYAVAYSNGTTALHGAYFAAGITAGDEVITTGMTFAATANAALYLGAVPKFADIDIKTGLIDPSSAKKLVTAKSKAIVGVDYAGHPCDIDELKEIARSNNMAFIVDGAHSLGAKYKGQLSGTLADMTTFSFHPVKTITTGEGGMVLTDREDLYHKLSLFRTHGIEKDPSRMGANEGPWYHEMQHLGNNYRLTDIQAALGTSQLKQLDSFIARRRQIATRYREHLSGSQLFECLEEKSFAESAYHLFPILVNTKRLSRLSAVKELHAQNIGVQIHYIPTYRHPYYQKNVSGNDWIGKCPATEEYYSRVLSLPLFPAMTNDDVLDVLAALARLEQKY